MAFPVPLVDGERLFYRPKDPEAILNALSDRDFNKDEQVPYWAEHWPAADTAARFLQKNPFDSSAVICELGCGLGVLTTVLSATCGAAVGMDISYSGCRYAAINVANHGHTPRIVCGDWRTPCFARPFEGIVAVDVLYEARWVDTVLGFIDTMLAENGVAIVADPCRPYWNRFKSRVAEMGLTAAVAQRTKTPTGLSTIEILRIVR